ncbi:MAG: TonB-dependent receptor [Bacteroidales bacterium]|nr:TonB-dependent receptor [Bacteroidales bacterium]
MKKNIAILVFLFALSSVLEAQQPSGTDRAAMMSVRESLIKGVIYDDDTNSPVEFTSVALYSMRDSSLVTGTISGPDGSFILKELPYGKYYLIANFMGYEKQTKEDLTLTPKQIFIDVGELRLSHSAQELDEVEVIASQAHVEYKIDRKVINVGQDINAATGTAVDVLQNTPSVNVDIDGNVSLRGSGNFTVLIDGKPSPLTGSDALQQIPANAIRNIEIITNPSAKFDPDGMAGIINIISKKNALQGLSGVVNTTLGTGEKYSGDFLLNYKTEKFNLYGGASYNDQTYSGDLYQLKEFYDASQDESSYDESRGSRNMGRFGKEIKGGIDYSFNESNILSLSGAVGVQERGSGGISDQHIYNDALTYNDYLISDSYNFHGEDYYKFNLNYTRKFADPGHEIVAFIDYSKDAGSDYDEQKEYISNSLFEKIGLVPEQLRSSEIGDDKEFRVQIDYTKPIGESGRFESGYQMRQDNSAEVYLFENYIPDDNIWMPNDSFSSANDFYRNIQAVYATYGNKLGKYQYQLGLRGEYTNRKVDYLELSEPYKIKRLDFFPTVHLSRSLENNQQLTASYSRRINRPRGMMLEPFITYMNSTTLRQGDPTLEPEYMNSYELGYTKTFGKSFIAFETYYKNTINKIERVQEVYDIENKISLMTYDNISQDHSLGGELMVNLSYKEWLNVNATSSLYRYWIEGEINGIEIDTRSNNWDMRLNTTFNFSTKTRLQLTGMYMGPSVTAQGTRAAFLFSNVALRHDFFDRKLSATLQVRDIFGTMKHEFTSSSTDFSSYLQMTREPHVVMLSLSYKINNYNQKRSRSSGSEDSEMGGSDIF